MATEITGFTVSVIAAAICLWTSKSSAASILGVNFDLFNDPSSGCKEISDWLDTYLVEDKQEIDWFTNVRPLDCIPAYIQKLASEPWIQILQKILDWHTALLETADDITANGIKKKLIESLCCLRHSVEYKKLAVWTKTVMLTL